MRGEGEGSPLNPWVKKKLKVEQLKVGLGLGQRHQYGSHEDFSSSFSVTMSPFRKTYNLRKFAI